MPRGGPHEWRPLRGRRLGRRPSLGLQRRTLPQRPRVYRFPLVPVSITLYTTADVILLTTTRVAAPLLLGPRHGHPQIKYKPSEGMPKQSELVFLPLTLHHMGPCPPEALNMAVTFPPRGPLLVEKPSKVSAREHPSLN